MDQKRNKKFTTSVMIAIVVAAVVFSASYALSLENDDKILSTESVNKKAAIIDQLHDDIPNVVFQQIATGYLEDAGYEVDLFTTEDITVDFYKNLPKMNYDYVVIRTHGATDNTNSESVVLFTGERFTSDKYISDQLFGYVTRATPLLEIFFKTQDDSSNWVVVNDTYSYLKTPAKMVDRTQNEFFAISPKFIENTLVGDFAGTTFILGGCDTMANPSMASSLIKRGASAVFGWDNTVGSSDNDNAILFFLRSTLVEGNTIDQTMKTIQKNIIRENMPYQANFVYYDSITD